MSNPMQAKTVELTPSIHVSRRTLLRWSALAASGAAMPQLIDLSMSPLVAQESRPATGNLAPLNRFSRMVQEWFVDQVRAAEDKIKQRLAALKTKQDAEAYVRSVQERIRKSFGPEPER